MKSLSVTLRTLTVIIFATLALPFVVVGAACGLVVLFILLLLGFLDS